MKKIKYLIIIPIFFVGLLIIGESYILKLENFQSEYIYTTLYLQDKQNEIRMKDDILKSANNSNVEVYTFIKTNNDGLITVKIYGSKNVSEKLEKLSGIQRKLYKSIFLEDINVEFFDLQELNGIKDIHDFYIIGDKSGALKFKSSLINKYAGNSPQEGYETDNSETILIVVMSIIVIITSLLTYYDALYQKKESIVRISLGEKLSFIIWKNIVIDSIIYIFVFILSIYFQKDINSILDNTKTIIIFILSIIFANSLIYLTLTSIKLKESFSNTDTNSKKLLYLNYSIKIVTIPLILITISSNLFLIYESYSLYKQSDFFKNYSKYSYITTELRPTVEQNGKADGKFRESEKLQTIFYTEHFEDSLLLSKIHQASEVKNPTIIANRNAINYLNKNIEEIKDINFEKEVYFIMPKEIVWDKKGLSALLQEFSFFEGIENFDYEVVGYKGDKNIIAINRNSIYGSESYSNPIIILNNISPRERHLNENANRVNYMSELMYKVKDVQIDNFKRDYNLQESNSIVTKTNILKKYYDGWDKAKKILYINSVFCILILFLEILIIFSILKLEYKVNSIELAIKKVFGYTIWQKNKQIFLISLITTLISSLIVIGVTFYVNIDLLVFVYIIIFFLIIIELIFILLCITNMENKKITKILKEGG